MSKLLEQQQDYLREIHLNIANNEVLYNMAMNANDLTLQSDDTTNLLNAVDAVILGNGGNKRPTAYTDHDVTMYRQAVVSEVARLQNA